MLNHDSPFNKLLFVLTVAIFIQGCSAVGLLVEESLASRLLLGSARRSVGRVIASEASEAALLRNSTRVSGITLSEEAALTELSELRAIIKPGENPRIFYRKTNKLFGEVTGNKKIKLSNGEVINLKDEFRAVTSKKGGTANFRSSPEIKESNIIREISNGELVLVLEQQGDWFHVLYKPASGVVEEGWMHTKVLTLLIVASEDDDEDDNHLGSDNNLPGNWGKGKATENKSTEYNGPENWRPKKNTQPALVSTKPKSAQQNSTNVLIQLQNNSHHKIYVAILYKTISGQWNRAGWWQIEPGKTSTPDIKTKNSVVYFYAHGESFNGGYPEWRGNPNDSENAYNVRVEPGPFDIDSRIMSPGNTSVRTFFKKEANESNQIVVVFGD